MDHILLPRNPSSPHPRIPLVCDEIEYCDDFLAFAYTYANRWGVPAPSTDTGVEIWLSDIAKFSNAKAVESFLQRWIFFGLLNEIFGPVNLYHVSDYIGMDKSGKFVHTKSLREKARLWSSAVEELAPEQKVQLGDRLFGCLRVASESTYDFYWNLPPESFALDQNLKISLSVIIETISVLADMHLPLSRGEDLVFPTCHFHIMNEQVREQMMDRGWCQSEFITIQAYYPMTAEQIFLYQMPRIRKGASHAGCDEYQCKNLQIHDPPNERQGDNFDERTSVLQLCSATEHTFDMKVASYTPIHTESTCTCDYLGPQESAIMQCLEQDTLPLLRISCDDDRGTVMEVVPYQQGVAYVAISHVWVDGLGNPNSMSLPACQAQRLHDAIARLRGRTFQHIQELERRTEDRELLLWCDTYCCPSEKVNRRGQIMALSKMKEVYSQATYVLVLDHELQLFKSTDLSVIETVARLALSAWMKRLWTFHEAASARKLLINFADRAIDLRDLWGDLHTHCARDPIDWLLARTFLSASYEMYAWLATAVKSARSNDLNRLENAVHGRTVSQPTDEPLCLAGVLDLDLRQVAETIPTQRMQTFWKLAALSKKGIHPGVVFQEYPRLSDKGYRWAPASLIRRRGDAPRPRPLDVRDHSKATWTSRGLCIARSGWSIGLKAPVIRNITSTHQSSKTINGTTPDGKLYNIGSPWFIDGRTDQTISDLLRDDTKEWYLIADVTSATGKVCRGLLVSRERSSDCSIFRSVAIVSLHLKDHLWQKLHRISAGRAAVIERHSIIQRLRQHFHVKSLGECIIRRSPRIFQHYLRDAMNILLRISCGNAEEEFEKLLDQEAQTAAESRESIEVAKHLFNSRSPPDWKSNIRSNLMDETVSMMEYFGADHEWCVD